MAGQGAENNKESRGRAGESAGSYGGDDVLPVVHMSGTQDTPWERAGPTVRGRFWKMLFASLLVHVFLTPGPALLGLIRMLPALDLAGKDEELVEVDLTALPIGAVAPVPQDQSPPEEINEPETQDVSDPNESPPEPEAPAPARDNPKPVVPSVPSENLAPKETSAFGDPVALAGDAGKIADSNANVRLFIFNEVIRKHPLGERIGELLRRTPQWRDFFGPSKIDPVADIDKVLIAGPELRNSSQVVAVVQHSMGRERIKGAFDSLVARQGNWIDEAALLAEARADRANRIFSAPNDTVVVVAPLSLSEQVRKLGDSARFPASAQDVAVTAYIITPANVAKGTGIQLPKSVKWVRLDLRPLENGGALLKLLAEDADAESAASHAILFEQLILAATTIDPGKMGGGLGAMASLLGVKKQEYLKSVKFANQGKEIHGAIEVTQAQLTLAADFLAGYLPPQEAPSPKMEAPKEILPPQNLEEPTPGPDPSPEPALPAESE